MKKPIIGITCDVEGDRFSLHRRYVDAVNVARGIPLLLPPVPAFASAFLTQCHGIILSGGDDPIMEHWGIDTHPKAKKIDPDRQAFELAILDALETTQHPALGVCLGMQLMGLHAGGTLDQHLPDTLPTAADHWNRTIHPIEGTLGRGIVCSHHRQALTSAGSMRVVASAPDGVIEAIDHPERSFYLGVQWHPERTDDEALGLDLVRRLVEAAQRMVHDS